MFRVNLFQFFKVKDGSNIVIIFYIEQCTFLPDDDVIWIQFNRFIDACSSLNFYVDLPVNYSHFKIE
jgi:hypothetical protein